jgi:glucose/arabinose dehydrogenase
MKSRDEHRSGQLVSFVVLFIVVSVLASSSVEVAYTATVPPGFTDSLVAAGLTNPTAMALAPDGRIFVCEQGGTLRVIKNGVLLATPFLTVTVDSSGERGLLGVAFDPNFVSNQLVYIYYTATTPTLHNRISRFIAAGNSATAAVQVTSR